MSDREDQRLRLTAEDVGDPDVAVSKQPRSKPNAMQQRLAERFKLTSTSRMQARSGVWNAPESAAATSFHRGVFR
jgi:hypothetical protein